MKIGSIQQNFLVHFQKNDIQNKKEANLKSVTNSLALVSSDSYGRSLVNFKSKSVDLAKKVASLPIDYKIAYCLENMKSKEILAVTNNIEKANKLIKENLDKINIGIRKIKWY